MKHIVFIFIAFQIFTVSYAQTATTYTAFQGQVLNLYAWEGSKVAVLSRSNTLNPLVMTDIVKTLDSTYAFYNLCTGRTPIPYFLYNGKSTVADVNATCGAGCGYLGFTGIELLNSYFDRLYDSVNINGTYDQPIFYEFGRNFWFFESEIEYKGTDNTGAITTGYAVFMRFKAMEYAGVKPAYFGNVPFSYFESEVRNLFTTYMSSPSYDWNNTLRAGVAPPNNLGLGATDLFASFLFQLTDMYGDLFLRNIWKKADLQPNATTTQEALDNFFLASCAAVNCDLGPLFTSWKFPISSPSLSYATTTYASCATDIKGNNATTTLKCYPNPSNGVFTIDSYKETMVTITTILGETVFTQSLKKGANTINLNNHPNGVYLIKQANGVMTKVIKY